MTVGEESHSLRGASDASALRTVRSVFERQEPMATVAFDDVVNPQVLELQFADAPGTAESARIDVRWSTEDDYNLHYTDSEGRNLRWDRHRHQYPTPDDDTHFHPPPEASVSPGDVERSCIDERRIDIVARTVQKLWRRAYEENSLDGVNTAENPP